MYLDPLRPLCRGGEADEMNGAIDCPCPQKRRPGAGRERPLLEADSALLRKGHDEAL
jgi:hypothetical protein